MAEGHSHDGGGSSRLRQFLCGVRRKNQEVPTALLNKARVSKEGTSSAQLIATLREASLPTASRQHPRESIVDFVAGRPIIDLRLANFDLLFCDAHARRVGWRWRKDGLRDAA
jgi:hypothetical protein